MWACTQLEEETHLSFEVIYVPAGYFISMLHFPMSILTGDVCLFEIWRKNNLPVIQADSKVQPIIKIVLLESVSRAGEGLFHSHL